MHLQGQSFDARAQLPRDFGELGVLLQQRGHLRGVLGHLQLPLLGGLRDIFAMACIRVGECLVAVRLARLRQQDQRRRVRGLQTEREI